MQPVIKLYAPLTGWAQNERAQTPWRNAFCRHQNINNATTRRGYLQHSLSQTPYDRQSLHTYRATQSKGFTLVELIVVIAIIGTAVGLVLPRIHYLQEYIESGGIECDHTNTLCRLLQERTNQSTAAAVVIVETETNAGIEQARKLGRCDGTPNSCEELQVALDNFKAAASAQSASVSVPGPLPIFGVASAFYFSRKLRKRIKASKSEKE